MLWFAVTALSGATIHRFKLFRRAEPLVFYLGVAVFLVATLLSMMSPRQGERQLHGTDAGGGRRRLDRWIHCCVVAAIE